MAQYSHLAVYKTAYDFTLLVVQMTKNCPKEFKYSLAEKIQQLCVEVIIDIYRANSSAEKIPHLQALLEKAEQLSIYIRLCFDLKIIGIEKYSEYTEKLGSISKQTKGWLASCKS